MIKGKALLVIDREDSEWVPFRVTVHLQSCSSDNPCTRDNVCEDMAYFGRGNPPLRAARKLRVGERVRVTVVYEVRYHQDYEGDWDCDVAFTKARVLRYQRPRYGR